MGSYSALSPIKTLFQSSMQEDWSISLCLMYFYIITIEDCLENDKATSADRFIM